MATSCTPDGVNPIYVRLVPKLTGGKRGPPEPIVTTSDEEENVDSTKDEGPNRSADPVASIDSPLQSPVSPVGSVDYENVSSPGNSSTASGPVYVRQPGFTHHAHDVTKSRNKKKKTASSLLSVRDGLHKNDNGHNLPQKAKAKKDPLPMRLRALPQSFWQQPNTPNYISPATCFSTLPPLRMRDTDEDLTDMRPVTPPDEREVTKKVPRRPSGERKISMVDTDQLFRLFDVIGDEKSSHKSSSQSHLRKARSRRLCVGRSTKQGLLSGNDPHLADALAHKLFPNLSLEHRKQLGSSGHSSLHMITLDTGGKSVTLPSLSIEQNFPQILSELVMHI